DQTEIVPILSGGVSFKRFLWPYFISSFILFSISLIANLFVIPQTNKLMIRFENIYIKPANNESKSETHMQIDKNTLVFIKNFDNVQKVGYTFILEKFNGDQLVEKMMADRIVWDSVKSK